jgi:sugar phosphate isomerase/epimerase
MTNLARRDFLKNFGALSAASLAPSWAGGATDTGALVRQFNLGAISDGFSPDLEEALKLMKGYGLEWVEIRNIWGVYNTEASPEQIRKVKDLTTQYGFRVSVVDTALYKCTLPGTKPTVTLKDAYPYSGQMELLKRAADRTHAWGTDKLRGFAFWRVADPAKILGRTAEELDKAAEVAKGLGVRILIEDEPTTNVGTGHEMARLLATVKASNVGVNWDAGNGYFSGEVPYPDGYNALPKNRIWHLHVKGVACEAGHKKCHEVFTDQGDINLVGQFRALRHDHYQGCISLECEFQAPGMSHQQTTERSMQGLLKVLEKTAA